MAKPDDEGRPKDAACRGPKSDGQLCDDGNPCTQVDTCLGGVCVGGNPKSCPTSHPCLLTGVCDPRTGACVNPPRPNGTPCDDGNACTQIDTCQGGVCAGGNPVECRASDQCHLPGTCNPATGRCSNPAKADGSACDDGNRCTLGDTCQAGGCRAGAPKPCPASDQCHLDGTCDPATGRCTDPESPAGSPCDDGNPCTLDDACQGGMCHAGPVKPCPAPDACHAEGTCEPATGLCRHPPRPDDTLCDDGDPCTLADRCRAGACSGEPLDCEDGFRCTEDRCREGACEHVPRHERCASGDSCGGAVCRPEDSLADFETGCTIRRARPDGEVCEEDYDPCTDDRCQRGSCVHDEVRDRATCAAVVAPYRRVLELGRMAAALDTTLAAWVPDGGMIGLRPQLAGTLASYAEEAQLVETILSGRHPVDVGSAGLAAARARAALPVVASLVRRSRAMLSLVRRGRQAGELPRESALRVARETRALLARSRGLERALRQIVRISRLFARG